MDRTKSVLNIKSLTRIGLNKTNSAFFVYLFYASILLGCVKSPGPSATELLQVTAPFFGGTGSMTVIIRSPTINYTLVGTCDDENSYLTEYSLDNQVTWTQVTCANKQFSVPLVLTRQRIVHARSRGKFRYSDVAKAIVRLLLPPSSDVVNNVAGATADDTDGFTAGSQSFLSFAFGTDTVTSPTVRLQTGLPRLTYE